MKKKQLLSEFLLIITALIWGFAFVAQRVGMQFIGPFLYTGLRFAVGALSIIPLLIIFRKDISFFNNLNKQELTAKPSFEQSIIVSESHKEYDFNEKQKSNILLIKNSFIIGVILFFASTLQQKGLVYTTAGKAGFITGLYVVFVPLFGLFLKKKPNIFMWFGTIICISGLFLLSITKNEMNSFTISKGDLFVLISSVFWALHITSISLVTNKHHSLLLAFGQFAVCSVLSFIAALLFENTFVNIFDATVPILFGGIMSIGVAFTLQIIGQKNTHPTHASIILSFESLFAAVGGWLFLKETFSTKSIVGCCLMLIGMITAQLQPKIIFRFIQTNQEKSSKNM